MSTPVPIRNRATVLEAIRRGPTLAAAAKSVSLSVNELRHFARSQHMHNAFIRLERGTGANTHPGFKDMTGKVIFSGSAVVIAREQNAPTGNARWKLRLTACTHEMTLEAIRIRQHEKLGTVPKCPACRAEARA